MSKKANINSEFGIGDTIFTFKKINKNEEIIETVGPFHNLVLDQGLDALDQNNLGELLMNIKVGSGTTPPDYSDIDLESEIASTGNKLEDSYGGTIEPPVYSYTLKTFKFNIGDITTDVTVDINEVGLYGGTIALFNRQVLPTTITIASDEGLIISTETRLYADMNPGVPLSGSFQLNDETITFKKYLFNTCSNGYGSWSRTSDNYNLLASTGYSFSYRGVLISNVEDIFSGSGNEPDTIEFVDDYISGSYERTQKYIWNPGTYVGDINRIYSGLDKSYHNTCGLYMFLLDNPIYLSDLEELTLVLKSSWKRYDPIEEFDLTKIDVIPKHDYNFGTNNYGIDYFIRNYDTETELLSTGTPTISGDFVRFDGISDGLRNNKNHSFEDLIEIKFRSLNKNKGTDQTIFKHVHCNASDNGFTFGIDENGNLKFIWSDGNDANSFETLTIATSGEYNDDEIYCCYIDMFNTSNKIELYNETETLITSIESDKKINPWKDGYANVSIGYTNSCSHFYDDYDIDTNYYEGDIFYVKFFVLI